MEPVDRAERHQRRPSLRGRAAGEPFEAQPDEQPRDENERHQPDQAVHQHSQQRLRPLSRRLLEQVENFHHITASRPEHEKVEEHADHQQRRHAQPAEPDALDAHQDLPADGRDDFHEGIDSERRCEPPPVRLRERLGHFRALFRIVKNPVKNRDGDDDLARRDERALEFHSPNRSFHCSSERTISSRLRRGLISHTKSVSRGSSGMSVS